MGRGVRVVGWGIRGLGLVMIGLGVLMWLGVARQLVGLHMLLGVLLVLLLWVQSALAARAGVSAGLVALAVVWGLVTPALGMTQTGLLPGSMHWVIQVAHLAVGIVALGLGDRLTAQARRALVARGSAALASSDLSRTAG
jgi:hypothetical protein